MELDKVIHERRSARKFKNKSVSWHLVAACLEAGIRAPSSGNVQNWRFIVIRDKDMIKKISQTTDEQEWIVKAPVLIVVCSYLKKIRRMFGVRGEALYAIQNCAAASENILLKAQDLGLNSSWVGGFDEDKLKILLEIEDDSRPQSIIALGYSEDLEERAKRETMNNLIFFEKYGEREDKTRGKIIPLVDVLKSKFKK